MICENVLEVFKNPGANAKAVTNARILLLLFLYGFCGKSLPTLSNLRYRCYIKSAFKTTSNIASLPPTWVEAIDRRCGSIAFPQSVSKMRAILLFTSLLKLCWTL